MKNTPKILACSIATLLVASSGAMAVDVLWNGSVSTDWNNPLNWNGGVVPTDPNDARIDTSTGNIATVTVNNAPLSRDLQVGVGGGSDGRLDHVSGTLATGNGGNWMFVGRGGGTGTYNLANTAATGGTLTNFGTGSGTTNITGRLYVGVDSGSIGTLNMNTSGQVNLSNDFVVGEGGTGLVNIDSGTINQTGGWSYIGHGGGGDGTVKMSGGTINNAGWMLVGQDNSVGHLLMSGGTFRTQDRTAVGYNNLGAASPSEIVMTGGTFNSVGGNFGIGGYDNNSGNGSVTLSGATAALNVTGQLWVGQNGGSTGVLNVSAGKVSVADWIGVGRDGANGTLTVSGTGIVEKTNATGSLEIGNNGASVSVVNLNPGGTIKVNRIVTGNGANSTFNFNGGTLVATVNEGDYLNNLTNAVIRNGGAVIDTNGFNITINQLLSEENPGLGSFRKSGAGTLVLGNAGNSFSGVTTLAGGTLAVTSLDNGGVASPLGLASSSASNLVFSGGALGFTGVTASTDRSFTISSGQTARFDINGGGTLTLAGAAPVTAQGITKIGNGKLILAMTGVGSYTGTTTVSSGVLSASGTYSGGYVVSAGGHVTPAEGVGTLTVPTLSLGSNSFVDLEFNGSPANDKITISTANTGLTLGTLIGLNLYNEFDTTPFSTPGVYTLFNYTNSLTTTQLQNAFYIANSQVGSVYSLASAGGNAVNLTISLAQTKTWITNGDGAWATGAAANWTPTGEPNATGAVANFTDPTVTNSVTVTVTGPKTVGSLVFDQTTPGAAYTLAGTATDTITFNNGFGVPSITQTTGDNIINAPLIFAGGGATTINAATGTNLTLGGALSGNAITLAGAGTVTLTGSSSTAAAVVINSGTLAVGNGVGTGGTIGAAPVSGAGGNLAFNHQDAIIVSNTISGGVAFTHNGTGTLTYSGNGTYTGATNLNGGSGAFTNTGTINGTTQINVNTTVNLPTGGSTTSTGGIFIGNGAAATVNATGGILNYNALYVGNINDGTLNISAGTLSGPQFYVGEQGGVTGTVVMSAGTLNTNQWTVIADQVGSTGVVNQTGGTWNQNHTDVLSIGQRGTGTYTMSGNSILNDPAAVDTSIRSTNKGNVAVGRFPGGNGTWTVTDNAIARIRTLSVGQDATSFGVATISGNAQVIASEDFHFGANGTGTVNLNGGVLNSTTGWATLGDNVGGNGTLNVNGGALVIREILLGGVNGSSGGIGHINITAGSITENQALSVGGRNNGQGYVNQSGGTFTITAGGDSRIGGAEDFATAFGNMNVSGGTFTFVTNLQIGAYGTGALNISGTGAVTATGGTPVVGRYINGFGVLDVSGGGTFTDNSGNRLLVAEEGIGVLNVRAGGLVSKSGTNATNAVTISNTGSGTGIVNLLTGGVLSTPSVGTVGGSSTINFSGGTLRASGNSATFMQGLSSAIVYAAGGIIDTQGNDITIAQDLIAASGVGVTAIPILGGGAGFESAPVVKITGDGTGATALATINNLGVLTGITITSAGTGYTTTTVELVGGNPTTAASVDTATTAANVGTGALTKIGAGTLHLSGVQGYQTLNANQGTTFVDSSFIGGTSTVNANANSVVNFTTDQTLSALNIGANAVVTLTDLTPFAGTGGKDAVSSAVVPEPGTLGLLLLGTLGVLSRRRRSA